MHIIYEKNMCRITVRLVIILTTLLPVEIRVPHLHLYSTVTNYIYTSHYTVIPDEHLTADHVLFLQEYV